MTEKWVLGPEDRDMIVMWHRFDYELNGERKAMTSSLCLEGKDSVFTAMSDTVGLPMALAVKPLMAGTFGTTGVDVPMSKTYYDPLLKGLADLGIRFVETELTWRDVMDVPWWLWGPWCWTCWTCAGAPDWPAHGEANARWVREAIAWRMKVGLNDCADIVPALGRLDARMVEPIEPHPRGR